MDVRRVEQIWFFSFIDFTLFIAKADNAQFVCLVVNESSEYASKVQLI